MKQFLTSRSLIYSIVYLHNIFKTNAFLIPFGPVRQVSTVKLLQSKSNEEDRREIVGLNVSDIYSTATAFNYSPLGMRTTYSMINGINASTLKGFGSPMDGPVVETRNGLSGAKSKGNDETLTAPEMNKWSTVMTEGEKRGSYRQGRQSQETLESTNKATEIFKTRMKEMNDFDRSEIEKYWDRLLPILSYLGTENVAKVKEALRVAYCAHKEQRRKSGEPFIVHPVEVSILLAGLKMDVATVISGLMHDTVEDTDMTFYEVEAMFGRDVKGIVEGETKVSKLPTLAYNDYADEQAENLRQMFIAMTNDYRIIIVKLADRLHNMRTLQHMKPAKQQKISRETLDIFAPLAHRMGIWQFKSELEDISFMYLYPDEYKRLNQRLRQYQAKFRETLDKSQQRLNKILRSDTTLREQAIGVKVYGRTKELYSLWDKMESKEERDLDHVDGVAALRVIIEPEPPTNLKSADENETDHGVWLCYHVLGLVQNLPGSQPMPTKVKDYISFPKPNGYQSLHTSLMLNGQKVEIQIRTKAMHQIAEYGMASSWVYNNKKDKHKRSIDELYNTPWLSSIKEWQDDVVCSRDFVESVQRELLGKRVFAFLRDGKILNLAKGATAIDAAFQIHTEVGRTMNGVEINGKPVPLSYELQNGDVVSILTGGGKPSTDWMRYAKTRSTRSKLRAYFRQKQRESLHDAGEILFMDCLSFHSERIKKSSFLEDSFDIPTSVDDVSSFLPGMTSYTETDEFFIDIGRSHDREFLLAMVANIFLVPRAVLVDAEENRASTDSRRRHEMIATVQKRTKRASVARVDTSFEVGYDNTERKVVANGTRKESLKINDPIINGYQDTNNEELSLINDIEIEVADCECLCNECLPVYGDIIIGTRPSKIKVPITTVHRYGCSVAQRTISDFLTFKRPNKKKRLKYHITSNGLAANVSRRSQRRGIENPVKLRWPENHEKLKEKISYMVEIIVVAFDRKLLLSDCSEIVSEMSEIEKTGSISTDKYATFHFLVRIKSTEHLDQLMNKLESIKSVMSVERNFGSSLL